METRSRKNAGKRTTSETATGAARRTFSSPAQSTSTANTGRSRRPVERVEEPALTSGHQCAMSVRSTRSSTNALIKQAELEAEKQFAELRLKEIRMEAELIRKRLEADIAVIEAEASQRGSSSVSERVGEWLESCDVKLRGEREEPHLPKRATTTGDVHNERSPHHTQKTEIGQLITALEQAVRSRPQRQISELPIFTGALIEWLPFKAAMRDSTELYKLSAAENLARLRASLRGEARETVSALLYTATNPDVIMRTLDQYYGRPEVIVDQMLDDLKKLPRPGNFPQDLNKFAVKLQNIVCILQNIDKREHVKNPMLVREVLGKLSPYIVSRWCDYACEHEQAGEVEIVMLSRFLMREADRMIRYSHPTATTTAPATRSFRTTETRPPPAVKRQIVYATEVEAEKKQQCFVCGANHEITRCSKFIKMDVADRWEWAKTNGVCFKCLKKRHRRSACKSKLCEVDECRRPHHSLLHKDSDATRDSPAPSQTEEGAVMSVATSTNKVLLKVCPVVLLGPGGEVRTHALLDEGSTVTLIDERLAEELCVDGPTRPLHIRGVNSNQDESKSRTVDLEIKGVTVDDKYKLRARTIRNLTLHHQSVARDVKKYRHLRGLRGVTYGDTRPRLLIGADHWHLIVSRQLRTGKRNEPAASRTRLGWVIHGTMPTRSPREENAVHHVFSSTGLQDEEPSTEALTASAKIKGPVSNREEELSSVPQDLQAHSLNVELSSSMEHEKILDPTHDVIKTSSQRLQEGVRYERRAPSKREALSAVISTHDPLELINTVTDKIKLQDLWRSKTKWNDPVPEDKSKECGKWLRHLTDMSALRLPRCYLPNGGSARRELHIYGDTSEQVCAAVAHDDGTTHEVKHVEKATNLWLKRSQGDSFAEERAKLAKVLSIARLSRIYKLDPDSDNGMLRVRRRKGAAAEASHDSQRLVLRPFTRLLFKQEHQAAGHANNERFVNEERQRYRILRLRSTVRPVARSCQWWRVRKAALFRTVPGDRELRDVCDTKWLPEQQYYGVTNRAWKYPIRYLKAALADTPSKRQSREGVLRTLLAEAKCSASDRLLIYVSVNSANPETPTLICFLLSASSPLSLTGRCYDITRSTWRIFWQRCVAEYLLTLSPEGRSNKGERQLQQNDVVLIIDATLLRSVWPWESPCDTYPGPRGSVSAEVAQTRRDFRRPTSRLVVLLKEEGAGRPASGKRGWLPGGECYGRLAMVLAHLPT